MTAPAEIARALRILAQVAHEVNCSLSDAATDLELLASEAEDDQRDALLSRICPTCRGCRYVADSEQQEPWDVWCSLPLESRDAVTGALVKPIRCPDCQPKPGAGDAT